MSRPLRILYENAWYHVMNRGAKKQNIFLFNSHKYIFLELLSEVTTTYGAEIHAYCLMDNHYHLLIRTPRANLPDIMRHIDGLYTKRFNHTMQYDGPLFRGRYKSILIQENSHLLQVSSYIHLNPLEANLTTSPEHYSWSSLKAYLHPDNKPNWLHTNTILSYLNSPNSIKSYWSYLSQGVDIEIKEFYSKKKQPAILGTEIFKIKQLKTLSIEKIAASQPDFNRTKTIPSIKTIAEQVATYYKTDVENLLCNQQRRYNLPRYMSIYITRQNYGYKLKEIADVFSNIEALSISTVITRMKKRITQIRSLKLDYENLTRDKGVRYQH